MRILFIAIAVLSLASTASAKLFSNSYVSFELPDRWNCEVDKTEWICRSDAAAGAAGNSRKEAMIILTAKEVGPGDSLAQYEAYLKTPKTIADASGKPVQSKIHQVKTIQIQGQPWVDGMHLASEVPFYYTRYLATVKQRIAVLVTFSAHQRYYTKYSQDFFRAIQSLKVIATPNLLSGSAGFGGGGGQIGAPTGLPSDVPADGDAPEEPSGSSKGKEKMLAFALILVAGGLYFVLKTKKKKPGPF